MGPCDPDAGNDVSLLEKWVQQRPPRPLSPFFDPLSLSPSLVLVEKLNVKGCFVKLVARGRNKSRDRHRKLTLKSRVGSGADGLSHAV